jgi:hypothetical protein
MDCVFFVSDCRTANHAEFFLKHHAIVCATTYTDIDILSYLMMDCWFIVFYCIYYFYSLVVWRVWLFNSVWIVYSHFFYVENCVLVLSMVDGSWMVLSVVLVLILSKQLRYAERQDVRYNMLP